MINKYWIELINKYSFIDKASRIGTNIVLEYTKDGNTKTKKIPLRTSVPRLQRTLKEIRTEIGVKNEKQERNEHISICAF